MRISMREFVPGSWSLPQNPITGGMGALADFVNGNFAVPQNPVLDAQQRRRGTGDFVGALFVLPQNPVSDAMKAATKGLAAFVPTAPMYPIAENSVLAAYQAQGLAGLGCPCGGDSSCGCSCGKGMGDISTEMTQFSSDLMAGNWAQALGTDTFFSIPVWVYLAGGVILWVGIFSGGEHSRYRRAKKAGQAAVRAYA